MRISDELMHVVEEIDSVFGDGYAAKHPELAGAVILAGAVQNLAKWVKYLGNGDATSSMGAIEHLATHLGEKVEEAANIIAGAMPSA
ncbi:MAG: hypothetical protein JO007_21475 [Alphaproteobacteria bacterium]|nr:hypothetical protein [Alphaproteobacteria bacterium]